ncbi:MAG: N-acetylglucosamine-6-phosphate deacetylase [Pseudomonadota bacterium]
MMKTALIAPEIFDGKLLHREVALLLQNDIVEGLVSNKAVPDGYDRQIYETGVILPGFVDLQVNGGGGVMFNDDTSVTGLKTIAAAHASTGTRSFLPTLITDTADKTLAAIAAVEDAIVQDIPGIVGIHLEGPHIAIAKKGAHDPALVRRMEAADEAVLRDAARRLPHVMVTVAPESVTPDQIRRLSAGGVIVALGHTACSFDAAQAAFAAGASCVTHLFNAMQPLGSREPGLVGAMLGTSGIAAGLIADNVHVHAVSMQIALNTSDSIFLVTDAMATLGSDIGQFQLNGRTVSRKDGRLTLADGTLAGADLDLPQAISVLIDHMGVPRARAYAMATSLPAQCLGTRAGWGFFTPGRPANAIRLSDEHTYLGPVPAVA